MVKEVEFFIYKYCMDVNWIKVVVEFVENIFVFVEIIFDLNWYMNVLGIVIEVVIGIVLWELIWYKVWDF